MHEVAIARALLGVASRHLPPGEAAVRGVRVAVGEATGIVPDALELAFQALATDTRFAAARLIVDRVPGRSRCSLCGTEYTFAGLLGQCPACGALGGELLGGGELELRGFEVGDV